MHTGASLQERVLELVFAPLENPGLLPELLPLILGAFVIELYFGKHVNESLGWNTSVGNAVLWVATGLNLLLAGAIDTFTERYAAYFLVAAGAFVGYMDFYHRWSPGLAFRASSADIVYPLAYVTVVVVQTGLPVDATMMKASGAFILGSLVFFRALRMIEVPARPGIQVR